MGQTIERIALERGHEIIARINSSNPLSETDLSLADVAIEFTRPELAASHIRFCSRLNLPVIVGTTGWYDELEDVRAIIEKTTGALLYASNFSIGVTIFFEINKRLAQLMQGNQNYSAAIEEIHHLQKLDSPSGTAITLANGILENNADYVSWVLGEEKEPHTTDGQLGITSYRKPEVPGTHVITYKSAIDTLQISHEAHNREGFALGSVVAAEWLFGKKGVFTMNDVLNLN